MNDSTLLMIITLITMIIIVICVLVNKPFILIVQLFVLQVINDVIQMYISHYFGEVFYREKAKISKING